MQIEHIAIWARDLEALREFYEKYFGAQATPIYTNANKGFTSYFLSFAGGARLEIMHMESIPVNQSDSVSQHTGIIHFAFSTGSEENVEELTERLRNDGFQVLDGPRRTGDGYYESAFLDLEGNRIEITV